jgi:hypothetical protein
MVRPSVAFFDPPLRARRLCLKFVPAIALLALTSPALAEDAITVSGTSRLRYEAIDG